MKNFFFIFLSSLAMIFVGSLQLFGANVALFDSITDTIQVGGHTILGNAATYEARVLFTNQYALFGSIYEEWSSGLEDKQFDAGPNILRAFAYPFHFTGNGTGLLRTTCLMDLGTWHHIAYVYDNSEERLYLDGHKVLARASSGNIGNGTQYLPQIGAIMRTVANDPDFAYVLPGVQGNTSFQGYIETLRISDVARYSGDAFLPPSGDLANDSHTQLLYDFNQPTGSTTIPDLSGRNLNGTLGIGFSGATLPEFVSNPVPEPSTLVLFGVCSIIFFIRWWRS